MTTHEWTEQDLAEYLLGGLSADARKELEQQYLTDPPLFERLEITEDELIDRYVTERLPWWTKRRFRKHYLSSSPHQEKVRAARQLMEALAPRAVARRRQPAALVVSYAAILLVAVCVSVWLAIENKQQDQAFQAMLLPTVSRDDRPAAGLSAFTVYPRTYRSLEEEKRIEIPHDVESVELRPLNVQDPSTSFVATVTRLDGAQVASVDARRDNRIVRIVIPAMALANGTYLLRLYNPQSGFQESYQFSVSRVPR